MLSLGRVFGFCHDYCANSGKRHYTLELYSSSCGVHYYITRIQSQFTHPALKPASPKKTFKMNYTYPEAADFQHSFETSSTNTNSLMFSQNDQLQVQHLAPNRLINNQYNMGQGPFIAPDHSFDTSTPAIYPNARHNQDHRMNLNQYNSNTFNRQNSISTDPQPSNSMNQDNTFNHTLDHLIDPTTRQSSFDINQAHLHHQIDTNQDHVNQTLNRIENHNHNQLSVPNPQRATIPININAIETNRVLSERAPDASVSRFQQPSLAQQKASSRARKSKATQENPAKKQQNPTEKQQNPTEKQPTHVGKSTTATKSSKAIVDEFLAPSFRLPDDISLPDNYTVEQLFNNFDAVELRTMADKHSRGDGTKKGVMSNTKKKILRDFHHSTEKLLAILCIHLGISQDVAATEVDPRK
ncbi:uncharacterized protein MELLADRAFT_87391 [Melampsora larici-populina 98AG31]|uniref:Uncharacterized protein n=1 Tax=Melampsora larici-populina (strain 98AG31 / pathotype 3-4-7) TaxID=747676 RepID=F4RN51_MELLP|nr:uncharacterized protein MELLADRAFT_87391 [Melampsora larici-populina 98AG31]EGG06279.1 hypothetical protein MELLADRAFT_87391 [Melampsora larici-populina 98AG31]